MMYHAIYVNDASYLIYVNGSYIGRLMHDFRTENLSDFYYKKLADAVRYFKETQEGQHEMSDIVKAYGEKCAAEAAEKAEKRRISELFQIIQNIMDNLKVSAEQAMAAIKINEQDQLVLRKMFA